MPKVHIGKKIKEVFNHSHYSATEFATRINKSRTVVYDIFERDTIDTGLLSTISEVLHHNFFAYYNDMHSMVQEGTVPYMSQAEWMRSISEELRALRQQVNEIEKRQGYVKDKKEEKKKVTYKRKR
jgi:hypothetical protein